MIDTTADEYASKYRSKESDVLQKLYRETNLKLMNPRMLSGHLQGKFLEFISCMLQPKQILEIGTFTGYSAISLAKGLSENGKLHTIDINAELETMARKYFDEAGLTSKIQLYIGDALEIIPKINETFDLVFIDADKEEYLKYFDIVIDKVRKNGIIIADNVLWNNKVLSNPQPTDKDTVAIQKFNETICNDSRVENMLLPVRDGLMLMRKT